jgi:hypothetical protein
MTVTLRTYDHNGTARAALVCADTAALQLALSEWIAPEGTTLMEIHRDGELMLTVFPDSNTEPPSWDPQVADVLARVSAVAFHNIARSSNGTGSWETMFPADPLIAVAADVLTSERLVLLRSCVPDSRALPGDWAPAALLRCLAHELTAARLCDVMQRGEGDDDEQLGRLLDLLPEAHETLERLNELRWDIGERARLLLVARGWLAPLDAP